MAYEVNHRISPDIRSSRESRAEAITAMDLLSTHANTFEAKRIKFTIFETLIASLSLLAKSFSSSYVIAEGRTRT